MEADISPFKRVTGDALRSHTNRRRATEVAIAVPVLNPMPILIGSPCAISAVKLKKSPPAASSRIGKITITFMTMPRR